MSCRRAFDVDLADFVASSARPEWAEFRAHYARCAECSAEVRAWTELHLLLQPPAAHPAEELLLRFETERDRLPVAARRAVEEHLAHCVSCNDELAALRRFDFTALEPRAAAAPAPSPSFAERFRRLVLHPSFAYAIVLLLLYPALEGRLPSRGQQAAREDRRTVADRPAGKSAPATRQKAAPAASANLARSENDVLTRARKEAAAPALGGRLGTGAAGGAEPAPKAELADEKASVDSEAAVERAPRDVATRAATPEPAGWKALALSGPGAPVDVAARDLGTGLVLTLTVPGATRAGDVEVRVLDARGGREMRERFARAAERVAMHLPAAWLTPGTYTAELRRLDTGPSPAEVFSFRVVP